MFEFLSVVIVNFFFYSVTVQLSIRNNKYIFSITFNLTDVFHLQTKSTFVTANT